MPEVLSNRKSEIGNRKSARRLIVNADDFGLSSSVNEAVVRAHRDGIWTSASLMVNEPGFEEAVKLAKENPALGVGLHLTFLMGHSTLPPKKIPGLVNACGEFTNRPVGAGVAYFFKRGLRAQLRAEIHAQFERFHSTGLTLDHVNGHLHLHLHPVIFRILMEDGEKLGIRHLRLTRDCLVRSRKTSQGHWFYRVSHAAIYERLSSRAREPLRQRGIKHAQITFGLLQNARVDEEYVLKLLPELPEGDSELYSHPSLDNFKHEFDALISPRVKELVKQLGIGLIRYQDL
ncbi:MAG TPA: hopanoid biosynthesis-associated protein HpnK [Verrucomicrobiae bacterium]|jgi:hopanoid biosynthesis associated protein HpnK|nr:hopanoid biosynthesis-associated protein HpnK [Verrucomicrobiae bacterium]